MVAKSAPTRASRDFAPALIAWQKRHGRHDLPWQNTRDPYAVWLSEIMLQQTQVAAAVPYYQRFLTRFPTLAALAAAPLDDVLALWSGLGYYSRARHLHRAAQDVVAHHHGCFPDTLPTVMELPGIGRSTAAAILVFAFGKRSAILDGNVKRVMTRARGIAGYPGKPKVAAQLWREAEALLPRASVRAYTQGLMDLGATVCRRRNPRCGNCPVRGGCVAYNTGTIARLPTPKPRKALPRRRTTMLILEHGGTMLLERRPESGIWGGLWCFPEAGADTPNSACLAARFGLRARRTAVLRTVAHGFTHFRLDIVPFRFAVARVPRHSRRADQRWVTVAAARTMGLPAPVRRLLDALC